MADSICTKFAEGCLPTMGNQAADWVRNCFSSNRMAEEYLNLYSAALKS